MAGETQMEVCLFYSATLPSRENSIQHESLNLNTLLRYVNMLIDYPPSSCTVASTLLLLREGDVAVSLVVWAIKPLFSARR